MNKETIRNMILREEKYDETMASVVLPYIEQRKTEQYYEREEGKRIFYIRCLADNPKGIAVISHGYTETIEKHLENIYYFLCGGYHVFMPEHCGHGHSYRMCSDTKDLSLVHVDDYIRYVEDLLFIARSAAHDFPDLPILLYGHSMGGGIAAAAAARAPELFSRLVLSSPMIRPSSAPMPWTLVCIVAKLFCMAGKSECYVNGNHPYEGPELFADSASVSEARFNFYNQKRCKEPLYQMSAASYGWLWQTARLNRYLRQKAWRQITCPVLIFQAENENYVSQEEQVWFAGKLNRNKPGNVKLIKFPGTKHEIFNSGTDLLEQYWGLIL